MLYSYFNIKSKINDKMTVNIKNKSLPSDSIIEKNKDDFSQMLHNVLNGTIKLPGQRETIKSKLDLIADILTPLQSEIESGKLKYSDIVKAIDLKLKLKISTQTLRSFCQDHLGFKKAERKKSVKQIVKENVIVESKVIEVEEDYKNESFDATRALSSDMNLK